MKEKTEQPQFKDISKAEAREALKKNMITIIDNAENFLKSKNISKKELASRMGSEVCHIYRMFKNKYYGNGLTINVLGRLAIALDVKIHELLK